MATYLNFALRGEETLVFYFAMSSITSTASYFWYTPKIEMCMVSQGVAEDGGETPPQRSAGEVAKKCRFSCREWAEKPAWLQI